MKLPILLCWLLTWTLVVAGPLHAAGAAKSASLPGTPSTWNGFDRYDFEVDGQPALVVAPRVAAPGRPWVWHGEYFGTPPEPSVALLGRGFHVVYLKVPDLFGSPRAVRRWDALYRMLTDTHDFSRKPALIGVSRGGLYCYNWAAANPDKVACIYGDAPVCDVRSWPLGSGKGSGNKVETPKLLSAYGAASVEELLATVLNPIDRLEPLARARVPLLHVYGDADKGVPWEENTGIVAERYRRLGGEITLIAKPGVGHVHGLADSTPIIDFISRHALAAAAIARPPTSSQRPPEPLTYFAFDDHSLPWRHNVKLTLVEATKHPANPVLRKGPPGSPDHGHAILYGTVRHDGRKFCMWYLGMFETTLEKGQAPGWWRPMCYAESDDGVTWTKPDLGLVEFAGNRNNNICLIESDPPSLSRVNDFLSVLYDEADPDPSRRYKATFIAHVPFADVKGGRSRIGPNESRWGAFICATSADGKRWKVVGDRPANAGGERFEVSSLYRFGDFYYATGQLISPWTWRQDGRDIGRVTLAYRSSDFAQWSPATAFAFARPGMPTDRPVPGQQGHMGFGLWNRGNVLVGLHGLWQDGPQPGKLGYNSAVVTADLGLCLSNDGIHFREPVADFVVLRRGQPGAWDDTALLQGHAFVNVGDLTYLWYSHWDTVTKLKGMEIGLATLRRDGFGYLSQKVEQQEATVISTTIPAADKGYALHLNVDQVNADAPVLVELLDHLARPLPAYSGANAASVTTPGVNVTVTFPRAVTPSPESRPFAVQVRLPSEADVRLYAIYAQPL